ncbi:hypothetical protein KI387_000559 [Taxus chinensis]|uniref:Uncharacterized protein n=1 Tax=Taxus chinensis TaxID=29808 RepID=A0AA38GU91_TAXCH|nr:hypothetical protein KI387_000559 [Taxus chinensis]
MPESEMKVEKTFELVNPSKPTPTGTLYLCNIDLTVVFPVETVYFFKKSCIEHSADDVVGKMRESLSDVLVAYHFMAGRLQQNGEDGRVELNYNRAGVLFAGASSQLTLAQLGDVSLPNPSFRNLVIRIDEFKELNEAPVMTMQVTRFTCGGFSIGLVTSHCMMDGKSASEFLANLASMTRGQGLLRQPNFLRNSLTSRSPPQINYPHHEYIKLKNLSAQTAFTTSDAQTHFLATLAQNQSIRVFTFSSQMVQDLKKKAMQEKILSNCSTFEVMMAHIWQARTKAVFTDPKLKSTVLFAVDIRSNMVPPLPTEFVGNGIATAIASASVQDLNENGLSFCVAEIQNAVARMTDDYVRSAIDWLEVNKGIPAAINGNFFLSAWWKLPFYELDFGWGRPVYAGPIVSGMAEFVLLLSNGSKGAVNVWLILEPHQMEKFEGHIMDI